ncbi:hypothetical protein EXIGLDRAFT_738493 [Exidia glandulosa HHB12029]|uniref:Six-hairpin glycosidase n=1 Tax=Exidia glandulosa HHB12029 TaxID=1314781 RepID=A0A165P0V3_EXIGL|nr:hypothetical protein EXIGLDRAFT_738493 [Exidia glandulosa HHB12029]
MSQLLLSLAICTFAAASSIDRRAVVTRYNPVRTNTSPDTPLQIGNGNFAFSAGIDGLQTFQPWSIMSTWGWKNDTLPPNRTLDDVLAYKGESWWNHDKLVQYNFNGVGDLQQWLISNPNRVNLGRVGLTFFDAKGAPVSVTAADIQNATQTLDLFTGIVSSTFSILGQPVAVRTSVHQTAGAVGVTVTSPLLVRRQLAVFLDFPWNDGSSKFSAPFVGSFASTNWTLHRTTLQRVTSISAEIVHSFNSLANTTFYTSVHGSAFKLSRAEGHQFLLRPTLPLPSFAVSVAFSLQPQSPPAVPLPPAVEASSRSGWANFWEKSGFVDVVTGSTDSRAEELQRRIILSRYLMRVNNAGDIPEQESGLVNNGWYGKFHLEMFYWHSAHWLLWSNDDFVRSSSPYARFLSSSIARAQVQQPWTAGARWGKMSDPSGRSAPGQINELLIWQQPHPLIFAEYMWRSTPTHAVLQEWRDVVFETAQWMADFAWWNETTGVFDLGPPMYPVSEDTPPNSTINTAFELSYWRIGLDMATRWMERLGETPPAKWSQVAANLAPLPTSNGLYAVYEGIEDTFWTDPAFINDHPALAGLFGWLPATPKLDISIATRTTEKVWTSWNLTSCWGWDFPLLAMSAARIGQPDRAVDWLLHPLFQFDDAGMPLGGTRVPTPYFPGSGALLTAIAFMAKGWDDGPQTNAPGFPAVGWNVRTEGIRMAL